MGRDYYAVMVRWGLRKRRGKPDEPRYVPFVHRVFKHEAEIHAEAARRQLFSEVRIVTQDECDAEERKDRHEEGVGEGKEAPRRGKARKDRPPRPAS